MEREELNIKDRYSKKNCGVVLFEFSDDCDNTYVVIDYGRYIEVLLVLVNYDKKDGSITK